MSWILSYVLSSFLDGCLNDMHFWCLFVLSCDRFVLLRKTNLPLRMDWEGQKLAEQWMQIMLVVFAIGAFITGFFISSFSLMVYIYGGSVILTGLLTIPNWPIFNRHPLKWLDPSEAEKHPKPQLTTSSVSKKKPTKK
ncbi:hypothetical protein L6452_12803 [Arctium lappa]|uniref:Uncharacterized protein n=1 Tax=Arctium lappa TaxID=4217 RepID=A0ACB9CGH6_ARCLA|nr:hypothetical protein L6452_12803 [Arctium lappa]